MNNRIVIFIPGTVTVRGVPGKNLERRCHKAREIFEKLSRKYTDISFLASGGVCHGDSSPSEAESICRFLVERGVPDRLVSLETRSRDTVSNVLFSFHEYPMLRSRGTVVIVVSQRPHALRIKRIFGVLGEQGRRITVQVCPCPYGSWYEWAKGYLLYEPMAWIIYAFDPMGIGCLANAWRRMRSEKSSLRSAS